MESRRSKKHSESKKSSFSFFPRSTSFTAPRDTDSKASSLKLEWLTSAISLLENTLKERSRQMEIQAKESDGLRKELRRKDAIINEYNAILKRSNDTEDRELERLRRELGKLRHTIIDNNLVIREYENKIEQLQNKNEKLMSVIRPPGIAISGIPRSRAQGVSASPMVYNTDILHRYAKNSRFQAQLRKSKFATNMNRERNHGTMNLFGQTV